jgi:poly(3-hydroxybutyrate) depolymerase
MRPFRTLTIVLLVSFLVPAAALPQALTSLASVRVGYNTRKALANPQGDLKTQIDVLDKQIADAARLGRNAELRRLYAKGVALLAGRAWTDEADYAASVVIRTDRVVVDSSRVYSVRLEQIYSPSIELTRSLTARFTLRHRPTAGTPATPGQPGAAVKDFGMFEGVGRDLRDTPFSVDLDVTDVADGAYQLSVDIRDDARVLATSTLAVVVRKGIDDAAKRLEDEARKAPDALRAEILYPVDRMRLVNNGRLELRTFDAANDFKAADDVVAAVRSGKDPFADRTGDFKRHYVLEGAGEIMPYRLYVPKTYTKARVYPLIVALHGLGGTEDSMFDGYGRQLTPLAEQRGYIVVAPLGYRVDGGYGWGLGNPPADAATRRLQELSEQDVMRVLKLVKEQYRVDENRIYLMGHSMGAIGTWRIAPKYPEVWAALGPIAGAGTAATVEKMKHIPQIVVHGDADPTVNVQGSRLMVAEMKRLGVDVKYIEVAGGNHSDVVGPNFAPILDFFDGHRKTAAKPGLSPNP